MLRGIREISRNFSSVACPKTAEQMKLRNLAFTVRSIRSEDIPGIVEIARENLFQFPLPSLRFWAAHDPDGIQVAVNESGKVLGVCATVKNNENLYFGGTLIVQEKCRYSNIGGKLIKACYDNAGEGNIGINCSFSKIEVFKKRNFKIFEKEWKSLEFESYCPVSPHLLSDQLPAGVEILPYHPSYLKAVHAYDRSLVGYERRSTIETCVNEKHGSHTLVAMKDGRCVGFGSIKLTIVGLGRVGPLYADEASIAEAMVKRLIPTLPEAKGFTMVTISSNILGNMILEKLQIPVLDNIYRMYRKEKLNVDTNKIFSHFDIDFSVF